MSDNSWYLVEDQLGGLSTVDFVFADYIIANPLLAHRITIDPRSN
jgi:hypothetical protein